MTGWSSGALTVALLVGLSGCWTAQTHTRPEQVCHTFDHPLFTQWHFGTTGDRLTFQTPGAASQPFSIASVDETTTPVTVFTGSRWTSCQLSRSYRLQPTAGGGAAFSIEVKQIRGNPDDGQGSRDDLWATLRLADARHSRDLLFMLSSPQAQATTEPGAPDQRSYVASQQIGGRRYQEVFAVTLTDLDRLQPGLPASAAWISASMTPSVGLVQYRLRDGRVYSRAVP